MPARHRRLNGHHLRHYFLCLHLHLHHHRYHCCLLLLPFHCRFQCPSPLCCCSPHSLSCRSWRKRSLSTSSFLSFFVFSCLLLLQRRIPTENTANCPNLPFLFPQTQQTLLSPLSLDLDLSTSHTRTRTQTHTRARMSAGGGVGKQRVTASLAAARQRLRKLPQDMARCKDQVTTPCHHPQ